MPHGNVMEIFHEFSMGFGPYEITMACPWNTHGVHSMGIPWTIHGDFIWAKTHGKPMVSTPWVFHGHEMRKRIFFTWSHMVIASSSSHLKGAPGGCSGGRGNMLAVGNCCYTLPFARGGRPPTACYH